MKTQSLECLLSLFLTAFVISSIYAEEERDLIAVLQSTTGVVQKCNACQKLRIIGTVKSLPALAALLGEEKTSQAARYALESIPGAEADSVLREALGNTSGLIKIGVINSIGLRRDREAVSELTKLLGDFDPQTASAAITALGRITGPEALAALNTVNTTSLPAALQAPLNDSLLKCAEALLLSGDKEGASKIYSQICELTASSCLRTAAYRGLILTSTEEEAVKFIEKGLKGSDRSCLLAALQMAGALKNECMTKALVKLLPKLSPDIQCALIDVLTDYGGPEVNSALLSAANSKNPNVRLAAIKTLGIVGDDSAVPLLLKLLITVKDVEQETAREALIRLPGKNTTTTIVSNLQKMEGPMKLDVIHLLGLRRDISALPVLLKLTNDPDEVLQTASIQSLAMLANESCVKDLVELLVRSKTDNQRLEIEKALISVCARSMNKELCAVPIIAALQTGKNIVVKCAMLRVCGSLACPATLNALREGIKSDDAEVRNTAFRSLASSRDPEALPDQLAHAKNTENQTYRVLLLRGCMKTAGEDVDMPAGRKIDICKEVINISDRLEEKMLVISCLGKINTIESLKMLEIFLSDNSLKKDAATAILKIGKALDTSKVEAAKPILQKAGEVIGDKTGN